MLEKLRTLVLVALAVPLLGGSGDPGLVFDLDREHFALSVRDLREAVDGPRLRVALGSPAHTTPAGSFPLYQVIRDPRWTPGELARRAGARRLPASAGGPMGAAKIPFAAGGLALHGGADPRLLGKPISLGCVRLADPELLALLDWLEARRALSSATPADTGERHQSFLRPARLVVR